MELEGLKRGLEYLTGTCRINVQDLITDRHVMIKKYMKEKQKETNHYFDVWHIAKGKKIVCNINMQYFKQKGLFCCTCKTCAFDYSNPQFE